MIKRVIAIPKSATLLEACEFFVLHKFFAFPVVDAKRRILGVVDISVFTEEVFDIAEREQHEDIFETIGFHVSQVRDAGPLQAFRYRFPWLLATIGSGTVCALLASAFALTLAQSLVIAFFLTLVLGLGESVSMQSMAVTIQALHSSRPTLRWYVATLRREVATALLLGAACGLLVAAIVWFWLGAGWPALVIGASILSSLVMACLLGLSIPSLLHALRLDPKDRGRSAYARSRRHPDPALLSLDRELAAASRPNDGEHPTLDSRNLSTCFRAIRDELPLASSF